MLLQSRSLNLNKYFSNFKLKTVAVHVLGMAVIVPNFIIIEYSMIVNFVYPRDQ